MKKGIQPIQFKFEYLPISRLKPFLTVGAISKWAAFRDEVIEKIKEIKTDNFMLIQGSTLGKEGNHTRGRSFAVNHRLRVLKIPWRMHFSQKYNCYVVYKAGK